MRRNRLICMELIIHSYMNLCHSLFSCTLRTCRFFWISSLLLPSLPSAQLLILHIIPKLPSQCDDHIVFQLMHQIDSYCTKRNVQCPQNEAADSVGTVSCQIRGNGEEANFHRWLAGHFLLVGWSVSFANQEEATLLRSVEEDQICGCRHQDPV